MGCQLCKSEKEEIEKTEFHNEDEAFNDYFNDFKSKEGQMASRLNIPIINILKDKEKSERENKIQFDVIKKGRNEPESNQIKPIPIERELIGNDVSLNIEIISSENKETQYLTLTPNDFPTLNTIFNIGGLSNVIKNDFTINTTTLPAKYIGISFNRLTKEFSITEQKAGKGLFCKINECFIIDKQSIFFFLPYQFIVSTEKVDLDKKLNVKFVNISNKEKQTKGMKTEFTFLSSENKVIKLGRKRSCEICFPKDDRISKIQCT